MITLLLIVGCLQSLHILIQDMNSPSGIEGGSNGCIKDFLPILNKVIRRLWTIICNLDAYRLRPNTLLILSEISFQTKSFNFWFSVVNIFRQMSNWKCISWTASTTLVANSSPLKGLKMTQVMVHNYSNFNCCVCILLFDILLV